MYRLIIIIFLLTFFDGCSGSARFTSNKTDKSTFEKNESGSDVNSNELPASNYEDEYKDNPVLESDSGVASFYSKKFHGKKTSSGETFDQNELTAAHRNYPFNTIIRVINLKNDKSVIVKVNNRSPSNNGRVCDLSRKAAESIGMIRSGLAKVRVEVLKWGDK